MSSSIVLRKKRPPFGVGTTKKKVSIVYYNLFILVRYPVFTGVGNMMPKNYNKGIWEYREISLIKRTTILLLLQQSKNYLFQANTQKELDEQLLAIETVNADSCWQVYRLNEDACKLHIPPQPKFERKVRV